MILDFPAITPNSSEWGLISPSQVFTSPLNGATQALELPGAAWRASLTFENLTEAKRRTLAAFALRLRGRAGRCYLHDHAQPLPLGVATGSPVVSGANQSGSTLITSGWTPSVAGILRTGDYIGLSNGELKMIVADANSDGAGGAVLSIEPPIRYSPTNASPITTVRPKAIFRMADPDQAQWLARPGKFHDFTLDFIEALV